MTTKPESYIQTGGGGTMFAGPDAVKLFRAAALVSGLRLWAKGIKPHRSWTSKRAVLDTISRDFPPHMRYPNNNNGLILAAIHVQNWIDATRDTVPVFK